jgi:hypothetical protein
VTAAIVLEVRLEDAAGGAARTFVLDRSPVRLGRSALNDLPIDLPFVSHCHAIIHFDEWGVRYVDLGSTNGSFVGATRIESNVAFSVVDGIPIRIGQLTFHLRTAQAGSVGPAKGTYSDLGTGGFPVSPAPPSPSPPRSPVPTLEHVRQACAVYRDQRRAAIDVLTSTLPKLEGRERDAWLATLRVELPELLEDEAFRRLSGVTSGSATAAHAEPDSSVIIAERLGLPPPKSPAQFAEATLDVLTRFAQAFVELRRGQQQFLNGFGLSNVDWSAPTTTGSEARQVLSYLLQSDSTPDRRSELNRAYADLMSHEVALVGAVVAGLRGVVEHLRPAGLGKRDGLGSMLDRLFPGRRLRRLEARIADLSDANTATRLLFGRAFADAYSAAHRTERTGLS